MEPSPPRVVEKAADLLSSFPAHLQDEILRRLDLRDVVRTSALSRTWRRRWESVSGLALSFPEGTPPCVVGGILFLYNVPRVSHFACIVDDASVSHLDHWLIALSGRSVESISIEENLHLEETFFLCPHTLHSSIFSCARLVSLDLQQCNLPPLPVGFTGFPVLEELHVTFVRFQNYGESQLQAIICGSPLLRVLHLDDVENHVDCVIEAPNLHSLTFFSSYDEVHCCLGELPRLQEAEIIVSCYSEPGNVCVDFLARVAHVRELSFSLPSHEVTIDTIPLTCYNLKSLELWTHFSAIDHSLLMFCLLRSSPNLETLKLQIHEKEMVADWEFLNAQWTDGMCANLQIVEIISARRWLPISFMKLILSKASLLRTFSAYIFCE